MKRLVLLFGLLAAVARAEWRDMKEGLDVKAVEKLVGTPLIESGSRGGSFLNWTYDNGGYVLFEGGRVKFWQAPRAKK